MNEIQKFLENGKEMKVFDASDGVDPREEEEMKQWFLIIGFLGLPAFILFFSILFLMYDWNGVIQHIGRNICGLETKNSSKSHGSRITESYSNKVICRQPESATVNKFLTRV
ncbi:Oidioi.mRNA.OKI2018_I69.PAR.g12833.t1.cds [Oikopleura dioica]|uniref:Oidioi.mRNA.OKI2018_I69.PAR.g12833.t1.cds n=1 Tax=Oikopleura dioica TaxID=34765 RepID=A0ABN7S1U7_OIKDI|nr:Oidioi.mRNA.OKI2018_I69.PAR.g12833.t1.cds [Oikopleura dioica]